MILSWASFYEGPSDRLYFDVLIPRIIEEILLSEGLRTIDVPATPAVELGRRGREIDTVAGEICKNRAAFHLVFIHADTGGRGLQETLDSRSTAYCRAIAARCEWPSDRCITLRPRRETEAWMLAEPNAVLEAWGYSGNFAELDLPRDGRAAERLADPKAVLQAAYRQASGDRGHRNHPQHYAAIAQHQSLVGLRSSLSFNDFESSLRRGLQSLGCIAPEV